MSYKGNKYGASLRIVSTKIRHVFKIEGKCQDRKGPDLRDFHDDEIEQFNLDGFSLLRL
jgi:hypothetical protein